MGGFHSVVFEHNQLAPRFGHFTSKAQAETPTQPTPKFVNEPTDTLYISNHPN
jgi:hypothetical protein